MAIGYTVSGIHKLQCDSWRKGTALQYVLSGPLGRDNFLVDFFVGAAKPVENIDVVFFGLGNHVLTIRHLSKFEKVLLVGNGRHACGNTCRAVNDA